MTQDEWGQSVNNRLNGIEKRLTQMEKQSAVDEVHRVNVELRLGSIEGSLQWLVRLVFAALILAVLTFALKGGLNI